MVYGFDTTCHVLSIEHTHTHTQLVKLNVPLTIEDWKGQKTNKQKTNTAKKKTSNSNAHDMSEQSMIFLK